MIEPIDRKRSGVRAGRLARSATAASVAAALGIALAVAGCGSSVKQGSKPAVHAVPISGQAAGAGYGYWLGRYWVHILTHSTPPACLTLNGNGGSVTVAGAAVPSGTYSFGCTDPAGVPLYVVVAGVNCANRPHGHAHFGTSDQQLELCARTEFKGQTASVTINGRKFDAVETGSGAESVPGVPHVRMAAYGAGLLLTGLSGGTLVIHSVSHYRSTTWDYHITVHVS